MGDPVLTPWEKVVRFWLRHETDVLKPFVIIGFLLLLIFMVTGCATTEREFIQRPTLNAVTIQVVWFDSEATLRGCPAGTHACATVGTLSNPYSFMYLVKPRSWDDRERICNAGHELMHALGGTHE